MAETIPSLFFQTAARRPYAPAYYAKQHGVWSPTNWKGYADDVRGAGKALIALGLGPGDKVCLLGFNRPEWVIVNMAAMAIGGVGAGIYTTCSAEEVQYIVDHAEARVVLLEDEGQWEKIRSQKYHAGGDKLPRLEHAVMMQGAPEIDDPMVLTWEEFNARADQTDDAVFDERLAALELGGLATLIYTSGTTGPPKGVMLSHGNLAWTATCMQGMVESLPSDVGVSYLPLSHVAEQIMTIHGPAVSGSSIYFAESIDKVPDNLKEAQPTMMFGVPRIWEKFYAGVSTKLKAATGAKAKLVTWVQQVCTRRNALLNAGKKPGLMLDLQHKLADKLVLSKLKPALGLGRARMCVSGAAPIAKEILEFFAGLDIVIYEVYGQSEDNGPTSFNVPGATKFGTVGRPIPGVEVRIAADGEIQVKGPNVFMGYYKEPEATAEALVDGWLCSGDLGELDEDGFLSITGRKKDIIITAGGKNIAPKNLEASLKNHDLINEAVVIGDRRRYLTALVTIDEEALRTFLGASNGAPPDPNDPKVRAEVQRAIDELNQSLARVEQLKKFTILGRNFSIEDGELTPTLKVKRQQVNEHFADEIESMYAE
ncbi:MAG TPA: long-chain fatty acid--CoA ligase [Kofleriaceae bacterium]|nr:long-chain fatty acid--CoA ligase [Kofleriaceae bacterium]